MQLRSRIALAASTLVSAPSLLQAEATDSVRDGGSSAIWIFANISFAGMRAQASESTGWLIITFIFGFPGTLLSLLAVEKGSQRMYGIDVPVKAPAVGV